MGRGMTKVFKALSDGTRQEILRLLEHNERTVGEIVGNFELSQPTISRHLSVLKEANLVVRDGAFAQQLRQNIHEHIVVGAREMLPDELAQQSFPSKLLRWLAYGVVRLLVGITGYGPKHWQADEETPGLTAESPAE